MRKSAWLNRQAAAGVFVALGIGLVVGLSIGSRRLDVASLSSFVGALLGAGITVWGALFVTDYSRTREANDNRAFLAESLEALHQPVARVRDFPVENVDAATKSLVRAELQSVHHRIESAIVLLDYAIERVDLREFRAMSALIRVQRILGHDRALWASEAQIIHGDRVTVAVIRVQLSKLHHSAAELAEELASAIAILGGGGARHGQEFTT